MEEVDTTFFSPDELCSLALEVFLEAGLSQPVDFHGLLTSTAC
jgi:hypothetical protein